MYCKEQFELITMLWGNIGKFKLFKINPSLMHRIFAKFKEFLQIIPGMREGIFHYHVLNTDYHLIGGNMRMNITRCLDIVEPVHANYKHLHVPKM